MDGRVTVPTILRVRAVGPVPARTESPTDLPSCCSVSVPSSIWSGARSGLPRIAWGWVSLRLYSVDRGWFDGTTVGRQSEDGDDLAVDRELSEPEGRPPLDPGDGRHLVVEGTVAVAQSRRGHLVAGGIPRSPPGSR